MFFSILRGQEKLLTAMREDTMRLKAALMQVEARVRTLQGAPDADNTTPYAADDMTVADAATQDAENYWDAPQAPSTPPVQSAQATPSTQPAQAMPPMQPAQAQFSQTQGAGGNHTAASGGNRYGGRTAPSLESLSMDPPDAEREHDGLDLHFDHLTPPHR